MIHFADFISGLIFFFHYFLLSVAERPLIKNVVGKYTFLVIKKVIVWGSIENIYLLSIM